MADNGITDSQDELTLEGLFRDVDQVHIPVFQREYIWTAKQLDDFQTDLRLIQDGIDDIQFLGAIVSYERPRDRGAIGRPKGIDVVDGQQRLLTLYIFVMALVEWIAKYNPARAAEIIRLFLLIQHRQGLTVNTRIIPGYRDRLQFTTLWNGICNSASIVKELGDDIPRPPLAHDGEKIGRLTKQYRRITTFLKREFSDHNDSTRLAALEQLLEFITQRFTFVLLELNDGATATRIFERLNYRGERVHIVDLVRNDVFSRTADEPDVAIRLYHDLWSPFEAAFAGRAEQFFFPYCLIHRPNAKKSELFRELRTIWQQRDPEEIISHMKPYCPPFLALDQGKPLGDDGEIHLRIDRMNRLSCPSSVYPFLMQVLHEYENGHVPVSQATSVLDLVESFLVRRAIMRFEPTGLHSLFKGLWHEVKGDLSLAHLAATIRERPTIQWPNDSDVREAIHTRKLAEAGICKYLLVEYDRYLPGDNPDSEPTIEHILPDSRETGSDWAIWFTTEQHRNLKNTWANLIPLSGRLNESLQRGVYSVKSERYKDESMFATPRAVATRWEEWNVDSLRERANILSEWAAARWPYGPDTTG